MFLANIKLKPNLLRYLAITVTITGVLFIILASFIGNFAVRLFAIGAIIAFSYNIKANYRYIGKLKRIADIMYLIGAVIVFIFPKFLMIIMGITILYMSVESIVRIINAKDYKDKVKLSLSILGLVFSILCIFFSKGTMNLIIRLLGALMMAIGCVLFYQYIEKTRKNDKSEMVEFKFENNSDEGDSLALEKAKQDNENNYN